MTRPCVRLVVPLTALWLASACLDSRVGITEPRLAPSVVIVSRPLSAIGLGSSSPRAYASSAATGDSIVYVSLAPGTSPDGASITIRNRATGVSLTAPLFNGGLDPVPVGAQTGDTLEFVVTNSSGGEQSLGISIARIHPPVIVRTVPPPGGTDVTLNSLLVFVFSEPMDPRTVTTQTMQVQSSDQAVAGTVTLSTDGLIATLQPSVPLAPGTEYTLSLSTSVADIEGTHLTSAVLVAFQTGGAVVTNLLPMVSAGWSHTCALTTAGEAYCWGQNESGELGIGQVSPYVTFPIRVSGGLRFAYLDAGGNFTCGLTAAGVAYCWGSDSSGTLGVGASDTIASPVPLTVAGGLTFVSLSVGPDHVCGTTADGRAFCWGNGDIGQLGTGVEQSSAHAPVPVQRVQNGSLASLSATGLLHTCGLDAPGRAYCWGALSYQVAPLGKFVFIPSWSPSPTLVSTLLVFQSVTTGLFHSCGITADGAAFCWGTNGAGELGVGDTITRRDPTAVAGGLKFQQIASGQGEYTCGIAVGGAAYCWGVNDNGQLGSGVNLFGCPVAGPADSLVYYAAVPPGATIPCSTRPIRAADPLTFASLSTGTTHTCGVTLAGELYCWGGNRFGQLGNGSTTQSSVPVLVPLKLLSSASP